MQWRGVSKGLSNGLSIAARRLWMCTRKLSLSARLALAVSHRVLSQWPGVARLTGAEYRGAVL